MRSPLMTCLFVLSTILWLGCHKQAKVDEPSASQSLEPVEMVTVTGSWALVQLNEEDATPGATLDITEGDKVSGSGGCNTYRSSIDRQGSSLSFDAIASTKKMCRGDVMAQESAYFEALRGSTTAAIRDDQLMLTGSGTPLIFERAPSP